DRRREPSGPELGRPAGERGDRRRLVAQADPAAGDGPGVLDPAPTRSHHGGPGRDRAEQRSGAAAPRRGGGAPAAAGRPPPGQDDEERLMGQKVHPIGFRLGTTRTWSSRWFASKEYANMLHADVKLRRYI